MQPPSAGGLPRCRTGQLSPAFTGLNAASGGGQGMTLILTNHSSRSCYLYGYVGLGLLGGHLTFPGPLPTHVTRVSAPHRLVRLHPGGNAQALLTWHDSTLAGGWLEYPQRVEITPPDAYRHLIGMWPKVPVNRGQIAVWPLRPAPAGPVPTGTGTVRNPFNGMCVTAAGNGSADGTEVVAWKCGRDGVAAVDRLQRRHAAAQRQVPGRHRPQHRDRGDRRPLGMRRQPEPAVADQPDVAQPVRGITTSDPATS